MSDGPVGYLVIVDGDIDAEMRTSPCGYFGPYDETIWETEAEAQRSLDRARAEGMQSARLVALVPCSGPELTQGEQ